MLLALFFQLNSVEIVNEEILEAWSVAIQGNAGQVPQKMVDRDKKARDDVAPKVEPEA
jgi:hypothetical protein